MLTDSRREIRFLNFSSVFVNEELEDSDECRVNDILIFMRIDEQELMAPLYNLDDSVKSGPDGIPHTLSNVLDFCF